MKSKTIVYLMALLVSMCLVSAGDFKIQHPAGTDLVIIDTSGYLNITTGKIMEAGVFLNETYWKIADVATPSDGDTTHLSTADQIYDYIVSLNYVPSAWNSLDNMTLNDGLIYIGDASNNPAAQTMSGHATITNAGVVTVSNTAGLSGENITSGTVADARIDSAIARDSEVAALPVSTFNNDQGYFNDLLNFTGTLTDTKTCTYDSANGIINCTSDTTSGTVTSIATTAPIAGGTITSSGTISLTACADGEYYLYNGTSAAWECETETLGGLQAVVDDLTPQLGGDLDLNNSKLTDAAGTVNMTIDGSGIIIVI